MLAGVMSRCITPRRCIPATARANPTASPISSSTASGFARLGQAGAADVCQHDRPRVPRRVQQLRDPDDTAQPLQHRHLVPQPPRRVRAQRLLADDRASRHEQPSHPRAGGLVHTARPPPPGPAARRPPYDTSAARSGAPDHCLHPIEGAAKIPGQASGWLRRPVFTEGSLR